MNNDVLNYGVYYTLDNGFSSYTEINETSKEGLELGFLDIYDMINISWIIDEHDFNKEVGVKTWFIEELSDDKIIYLNEEDKPQ